MDAPLETPSRALGSFTHNFPDVDVGGLVEKEPPESVVVSCIELAALRGSRKVL
jgi:hypothetical protein